MHLRVCGPRRVSSTKKALRALQGPLILRSCAAAGALQPAAASGPEPTSQLEPKSRRHAAVAQGVRGKQSASSRHGYMRRKAATAARSAARPPARGAARQLPLAWRRRRARSRRGRARQRKVGAAGGLRKARPRFAVLFRRLAHLVQLAGCVLFRQRSIASGTAGLYSRSAAAARAETRRLGTTSSAGASSWALSWAPSSMPLPCAPRSER